MIGLDVLDRLPDAPFKVRHNDAETIGGFVNETLNGFTYWNGERTIEIDDTYEVTERPEGTTFYSSTYDSTIHISKLEFEDAHLLANGQDATGLPELVVLAMNALNKSISYSTTPEPVVAALEPDPLLAVEDAPVVNNGIESLSFTITVDSEEVLELLIANPQGISVRESGEWVKLNLDDDQPTIEDQEWLDVSPAAIDFWDTLAPDAQVMRQDVIQYALPAE